MENRKASSAGPLILYELNEVSWRVIDWYVGQRPRSCLAMLLPSADTYTSLTRDQGELHPWVTWPTLHRSVYNTVHRIRFINQDLSCGAAYPPIWERIAAAGKRVGVFGSLQSYPPPGNLPFVFYVPDTFAPSHETIPPRYACFQRLNLRQTQSDRAVAKPVSLDGSSLADLRDLLSNGLRIKTILRLALQLLAERTAPINRSRRPILQAPIAFDVFRHALTQHHPDFCTFFTNHVAGIMHRYWKYAFPEDFSLSLSGPVDAFHRQSLLVAMDHADEQIAFLKSYLDDRGGCLYIASSMGQEAIRRQDEIEVTIDDAARFMNAIGFNKPYKSLLAMHPEYSLEFESDRDARAFNARVQGLRRASGTPAFSQFDCAGKTLSCSIGSGDGFEPPEGGPPYLLTPEGKHITFEEAGLSIIRRDVGTGYHQPEGILIRYGAGVTASPARRRLETVAIAPMIMSDLGLERVDREAGRTSRTPVEDDHELV